MYLPLFGTWDRPPKRKRRTKGKGGKGRRRLELYPNDRLTEPRRERTARIRIAKF